MLGTANESVNVPGNLTVAGSINNISKTVFGYLSNVSSNIQSQINTVSTNLTNIGNNPLVLSSTLNVSGLATLTQVQINTSLSVLQNISFSGTLNNIAANTFSYLSGLTSNIQNQINAINNVSPVGSVIQFAGNATSLPGYLPCDGTQYLIPEYLALFRVIGYLYGGDEATGRFRVPNYRGIFLRGAGTQIVSLNAIAGSGNAVAKTYSSPPLGVTYADETQQTTTSDYVNQINQEVKTFVTGGSGFGGNSFNFNYANAVASLNYSVAHDTLNIGHVETFPVHTSVQYFIRY
jgi:microcystin-dependent protein